MYAHHVALTAYYLRAGIVFGGVCESVSVSVRVSAKNLEYYRSEIDVTWYKIMPYDERQKSLEVGDI